MKIKSISYSTIKYYIIFLNIIIVILNGVQLLNFVTSMIILTLLTLVPTFVYTIIRHNKFSLILKSRYPVFYRKYSSPRYNLYSKTYILKYNISKDKEFISLLDYNERNAMNEFISATKIYRLFILCIYLSFSTMVTISILNS